MVQSAGAGSLCFNPTFANEVADAVLNASRLNRAKIPSKLLINRSLDNKINDQWKHLLSLSTGEGAQDAGEGAESK